MEIQTVLFKEFFSFNNFTFVTRKWENKNAPIELVTQRQKNKSLTIKFNQKLNLWVSSLKFNLFFYKVELVTQNKHFYKNFWVSKSECDAICYNSVS